MPLNEGKSIILQRHDVILFKIFSGSEETTLRNDLKQYFENVKFVKPASSRSESSEIFVFAEGFKV